MSLSHYAIVLGLVALICLAETAAQLCFKTAVEKLGQPAETFSQMLRLSWHMLFMFRVWIGMWLGLAILGLWISVLAQAELNFAFSLSSIHYVFIALAAKYILKERVSRRRWVATLLIALGIVIVSLSGAQP